MLDCEWLQKGRYMETNREKAVRIAYEVAFPYEEYRNAIEAESNVRRVGITAVVQNVESDENNPGCYILGVKTAKSWDDGSLEEGSVVKDGFAVGDIVSDDAEAALVTVKGDLSNMPSTGDEVLLSPPDYLQKLREFAGSLITTPEKRNEGRFLALRETLLTTPEIVEMETPSAVRSCPACSIISWLGISTSFSSTRRP